MMGKIPLLVAALRAVHGLPSNTLSVMSYNIMDSGFADESGRYDPVGDRIPARRSSSAALHSYGLDAHCR